MFAIFIRLHPHMWRPPRPEYTEYFLYLLMTYLQFRCITILDVKIIYIYILFKYVDLIDLSRYLTFPRFQHIFLHVRGSDLLRSFRKCIAIVICHLAQTLACQSLHITDRIRQCRQLERTIIPNNTQPPPPPPIMDPVSS